jgi:hypothetical protein
MVVDPVRAPSAVMVSISSAWNMTASCVPSGAASLGGVM